jgi:hypothetical protein
MLAAFFRIYAMDPCIHYICGLACQIFNSWLKDAHKKQQKQQIMELKMSITTVVEALKEEGDHGEGKGSSVWQHQGGMEHCSDRSRHRRTIVDDDLLLLLLLL